MLSQRYLRIGVSAFLLVGLAWAATQTPRWPDEKSAPPPATSQPVSPIDDQGAFVTGLIGSKHDFSQSGRFGRDMCLPCHAPHLVETPAPLLDREPASTQPMRSYQTLGVELDGASVLCLSCHDGVIAMDVYTASHATHLASQLGNSRLPVGGLAGHPVGIAYPVGRLDYNAPAAVASHGGMKLPDGRIQCTSCHDPHNTGNHRKFLWISNERSRLCLACHRL